MSVFHPVSREDIPLLNETMGVYSGVNSDLAPANCLAWGGLHDTFVRFDKGVAQVRYRLEDTPRLFLYPVGPGDTAAAADALIAEERHAGMSEIRFMCDEEQTGLLPEGFKAELRRELTDYVFDARAYAACQGHRYQRLRNFISASKRRYEARFEELGADNGETVLALARETMSTKDESMQEDLEYELHVIRTLLDNAEALRVAGMLAYEGETPIAALMASRPRDDMLDIHILKQNPGYTGIAQRLTHRFVSQWVEKADVRWFNMEEDLGLMNLRKSKLSQNPDLLADKYLCTLTL